MQRVVLSIGGSLINPGKPDVKFLKSITALIVKLKAKYQLAILCGGGQPARDYANAVRSFGGNEFVADEAAILMTRANAFLMVSALGEHAYPDALCDFTQAAAAAATTDKIVVMSGTIPGFTTDADAALLAEKIEADKLVNLSNIDGIYDRPPKKPGAKKFATMRHEDLIRLANEYDLRKAGTNFIFDNVACKIAARSKIETHFINGRDLKQVEAAITGGKHKGTVVKG